MCIPRCSDDSSRTRRVLDEFNEKLPLRGELKRLDKKFSEVIEFAFSLILYPDLPRSRFQYTQVRSGYEFTT